MTYDAEEEWRSIKGYEDAYEASSAGRIRSLDRVIYDKNGLRKTLRGKVLKPQRNTYLQVGLSGKSHYVHRLIAETFLGMPPEGKNWVLHGEKGRYDNSVSNLRWGSPSENSLEAVKLGTMKNLFTTQSHCVNGHPFSENGYTSPQTGVRYCIPCHRSRDRVRYAAKRKLMRVGRE